MFPSSSPCPFVNSLLLLSLVGSKKLPPFNGNDDTGVIVSMKECKYIEDIEDA